MWELILCNFVTGQDKTYRFDVFADGTMSVVIPANRLSGPKVDTVTTLSSR